MDNDNGIKLTFTFEGFNEEDDAREFRKQLTTFLRDHSIAHVTKLVVPGQNVESVSFFPGFGEVFASFPAGQ